MIFLHIYVSQLTFLEDCATESRVYLLKNFPSPCHKTMLPHATTISIFSITIFVQVSPITVWLEMFAGVYFCGLAIFLCVVGINFANRRDCFFLLGKFTAETEERVGQCKPRSVATRLRKSARIDVFAVK